MFGRLLLASSLFSLCSCAALPAPQSVAPVDQTAWAEQCSDWDEWDKPGPAFRILGNTYYVGTCGIAAILITGDEGHVLIDTGTEAGAEVVRTNIEALGFELRDIRIILQSHEHFDHVGGVAKMQRWTGARVIASEEAAVVLASGTPSPNDPQHGILPEMESAEVSGTVSNGEMLQLGSIQFTAIATPGHTPGALTWSWSSCSGTVIGDVCASIGYADSLSAISADNYRFSDHPEYVRAYRDGIARLAELDCDILITPHPSASGMRDKLLEGDLTNGMDCAAYAANRLARLEARLARETEEAAE
ncbi:subclass B3 metallo-beta-lactamase [Aurantiacibacter sp. D1-12]|uniref:subclass B3 metallo-beta-lactamase n=1 Tax=Aurantiacibacter sp. D1-12 TaxID=2993658 RepID=UPI00237C7411|nr:subclass B3 metallo-beta-lactamase [Aurantiacibacter sp. D1-12]MDE1468306.1 subclass B3 metallo-beta-lactamase [Aurantiacibacter sp. D1-12]